MKHTVAVYGSLKEGFHNHSLLKGAKKLGEGLLSSSYLMHSYGSCPALERTTEPSAPIHVEVYEVDDKGLEALDYLEGYHPDRVPRLNFYQRTKDTTTDGLEVWVYVVDEATISRGIVASGKWEMGC